MRSAQNSFLLRGLCCGTSSYKRSLTTKSEDPKDLDPTSSMSPKIMRPNSGDTGLISGSEYQTFVGSLWICQV